jgi:hypothetical protein
MWKIDGHDLPVSKAFFDYAKAQRTPKTYSSVVSEH